MSTNFLDGNEAIAIGAIKSGCNFFAGYPITPATSIFNVMMKFLPKQKGICFQGEDEIASIGFCLGASMSGRKAMTATSGPGISLYSEHISFAIGSEIPIVIVDVQRLGPSTGSATLGADGDIQFLRWGNSGGLPIIVLAPSNVKDCYLLTFHAFNLAEKYRCPVFIASNKEIATTKESLKIDEIDLPVVIERKKYNNITKFKPFMTSFNKNVPDFLPVGSRTELVRQTSSTHGIDGYITNSSKEINVFQNRLMNKLKKFVEEFTFSKVCLENKSDVLIICYGVTSKSVESLYEKYRSTKRPISILILKTLWPVPSKLIKSASLNVKKIVVPEMNLGLYVLEIKRIIKNIPVISINRMDGSLITPEEIEKEL